MSSGKQSRTEKRGRRGRTRLDVRAPCGGRPAPSVAAPRVPGPTPQDFSSSFQVVCHSPSRQRLPRESVWGRAGHESSTCVAGPLPRRWGEEGSGAQRGPEKDAVAEPRCLPGESSTRCAGADRRGGKGAGSFQSWLRHLGICPSGLGVCYAAPLTLLALRSACPIPRAPALPPGRCGGPREAPQPSARPSARPNPLGSEDPDLRPGVVSGCGASVLQNRGIRVSG